MKLVEARRLARSGRGLASTLALCAACGDATTLVNADAGSSPTLRSPDAVVPRADAGARSCDLPPLFGWEASPRLIEPSPDGMHDLVAIKDPSVIYFEGRWHVYATSANSAGEWSLVYLSFESWSAAATAPRYHMSQTPGFEGHLAAPQLFYFEPQRTWYLVFQTQPPTYSTSDDPSRPETWAPPRPFFAPAPPAASARWRHYWVICDDSDCHLFFTAGDGAVYRSQTRVDQFPRGMSNPVSVMWEPDRNALLEGSATYKLKDAQQYLTIVEAIGGPARARHYRSFTSDRLDGEWTPLAHTWEEPFAGQNNVKFEREPWTLDISHGELLRDGYDQTMTLDPCGMRLLYQGRAPESGSVEYSQLPYGLGLLRQLPRAYEASDLPAPEPPLRSAPPLGDRDP